MKPPSDPAATPPRCDLTLLATSDLHLHLCPWDYYRDRPAPGSGLASVAGRIAELRAGLPNCLLFDNGDLLQGTPLGDALAETRPPTAACPHPMIAALNLLRYDAMALGNHDFDFGLDYLGAALAGAAFPVLCANLRRVDGGAPLFGGWTILERRVTDRRGRVRPLRLGVVGFLPHQVTVWASAALEGRIEARPIVETARRVVPRMIAAGAEVVVALCHSGIGTTPDPGAENVAHLLAAVPGIDAVIGGHSHEVFPPPGAEGLLAGKPACLPGHAASHLGLLRLELEQGPDRRWRCRGGAGSVVDLTRGPKRAIPAPFLALCEGAHGTTRRHLDRPAGRITAPLTSLFAMAGHCPATRLVARAMRWHVAGVLAAGPLAALPVLAAAAPARAGGRGGPENYTTLPAGPLRERDLAALCPFPNAIRALRVTGAELAEWLEHSAGSFLQVPPGARDAPLLDPARPAYNFDLIEGLGYEIDLSAPARYGPDGLLRHPEARRVRDLRHEGRPLDPAQDFVLATTSFRASGGGGYPGCGIPGREVLTAPTLIRSILGGYLALEGPYAPPPAGDWRFAPMPGTSVVLPTGPAARALLPRPGLTDLGQTPEGFLSLRLAL